MKLTVDERFARPFASEDEIEAVMPEIAAAAAKVFARSGEGAEMLGWLDLPENYDRAEYARLKEAARRIRSDSEVLIVIGIGGSYLGSRTVIEFLKSPRYNELKKDTPSVYFSGDNLSGSDLDELLSLIEGRDFSVNVISKSGTTTEPAVAFRIFRAELEKRYGAEGAASRIYVTTDARKGTLKAFADRAGYETFTVPDSVGGRFSVLTSVGLLPIAVAGIDTDALLAGAACAMRELAVPGSANPAFRYAALRNLFYRKGRKMEILAGYEPFQLMLNEWWKQLFGESEGKDGKGLYPSSVVFTTDLHSLGQYVQSGERIMFETVLTVDSPCSTAAVPYDPADIDGLNFLAGAPLDAVNKAAMQGTLVAHADGGVPNIVLRLAERSEEALGELIYFFEFSCAVSGYTLGVNPFNQPGVEVYKRNMFSLLGKPGYEDPTGRLAKII